jgi:hypothetical protein
MRWFIASLLAVAPLVFAPSSASALGCPAAFVLHNLGEHDHEGADHRHVGLSMDKVDKNSNGLICVKQVTPDGDIHVHIDDHTR